MDSNQKAVQEFLLLHTPAHCPNCGSKVKKYKNGDGGDGPLVMCKSPECSWPIDVILSSLLLTKPKDIHVTPPPLLPSLADESQRKTVSVIKHDSADAEDEVIQEVLVDVVNTSSISSSEDLSVQYSDDMEEMRVSFLSPHAGSVTGRTWVMFPPLSVKADQLQHVLPLLEEFSKEFLKKSFPEIDVIYTTKAAVAKHSLSKELVRSIKSLFTSSTVKKLLPKAPKPKPATLKKEPNVKVTKEKVVTEKKVKVKEPKVKVPTKPKKVKLEKAPKQSKTQKQKTKVKLPKVKKNVASKGIQKLIMKLLQTCIRDAIKESETKKFKGKLRKRKLEEQPTEILQITINPQDFILSNHNGEDPEHVDPNEGFDLNQDDLDLHEFYPLNLVNVEYAEVPKKKRRKKNDACPAVINPEHIDWQEIGFWGEELEEDEIPREVAKDEDYDVFRYYSKEKSRRRRRQNRVDQSGQFQLEEWTNVDFFRVKPQRLAYVDKEPSLENMIFDDEELDGEELVMRIAENLASKSFSKSLQTEEATNPDLALVVSTSSGDSPVIEIRPPGLTTEPSLSNSELLGDINSEWFSVMRTAANVKDLDLLKDKHQDFQDPKDDVSHAIQYTDSKKQNVVFHIANEMAVSYPSKEDIDLSVRGEEPVNVILTNTSSVKDNISKTFLDTADPEEKVWFVWRGETIDEDFIKWYENYLQGLVSKLTDVDEISEGLALVREKENVNFANEAKRELEVDRMIQFYTEVYSRFKYLRGVYPVENRQSLIRILKPHLKMSQSSFFQKFVNLDPAREVRLEDKENWKRCRVIKFNRNRGKSQAEKTVQFFFTNPVTGSKLTFAPVSVASEEQQDHVVTLVSHYSAVLTHKLLNPSEKKGSPRKTTEVLKAENSLPVNVVDHIKACFTKSKMELLKPGRRTHKGVKKCEKVASLNHSTVISKDAPSHSGDLNKSSHNESSTVIDEFEFLAMTPREYNLRTREEKEPPMKYPIQVTVAEDLEDDPGSELTCQEPEKIVDIGQASVRSLVSRDYEEDLEVTIPEEQEFKEVLEKEIFGDKMPPAVYSKGPRKGLSDRKTGRGGRNELLYRKLRDSQVRAGVEYMLDPISHPKPNFRKMIQPGGKRQRIKMEDLEDELDDEDFMIPIKKQGRKNIRRSGRLQLAQQKKESGEYFEEHFEVDIKMTDSGNESEDESIPKKKLKMENALRSDRSHFAQLKKDSGEYFDDHFEADTEAESDTSDEDNPYIDERIEIDYNESNSNSSSDEDIDGYLTKSLEKFYHLNIS